MTTNLDDEFAAVILELGKYLCVTMTRDYFPDPAQKGKQDKRRVLALMVAAFASDGCLVGQPPLIGNNSIRFMEELHWLWRENEKWIVDYYELRRDARKSFTSRGEAVVFLQDRIQTYWVGKLTKSVPASAQPLAPADVPAAPGHR